MTNTQGCPSPSSPTSPTASVFAPGVQTLTGLADGNYLLHYFAQDCAGTEELKFTQDNTGSWSTGFYTFPINVDTVAPAFATGPVLSPASLPLNSYPVGTPVTVSYSCTDALSGVIRCGSHTYAPGTTTNTGILTDAVNTSVLGTRSFSVLAVDAAGNQSTATVNYSITGSYDSQVKVVPAQTVLTYPQSTLVQIVILPPTTFKAPKGTVRLMDGANLLTTLTVGGNGTGGAGAFYFMPPLSAGPHALSAVYSGDSFNPGGTSAPTTVTVQPAPVRITVSCLNPTLTSGSDYVCVAYTLPISAGAGSVVNYSFDGGAPLSATLTGGAAHFTIAKPGIGTHSVVVSYPAQGNFAAAIPQTMSFKVIAAN